jgi:hypothetical protein
VKAFVVYTLLRAVLFVAAWLLILGIWKLVDGGAVTSANLFWAAIGAFIASGVASYFLLSHPREELARRVEQRASKAVSKFDELRTKED